MKISKKKLQSLSGEELAGIAKKLLEIDEANKYATLEKYLETAHEKQTKFHKDQHRIRYFFGGNRSGKSTGGFVEDIWWSSGRHPFRNMPTPNKGLIVIQDFENHGKNILEPKIKEWMPKGLIADIEKNQNGAYKKITLVNGSTIDIASHDQDIKVFEGSDYDWAHFDEPPPKQIFSAVWRGLTDRGGSCWVTATPLLSPWMYQEYKKAENGDDLRWFIYVSTYDNAKNIGQGDVELGKKRINEFAEALDADEKEARLFGRFVQMRGLIFKEWSRGVHLVPEFHWPSDWPIYESIDPHPSKPWAISWVGISENGKKLLLRSGLYEGVIDEIADQILYERNQIKIQNGRRPLIVRTLIDNAASVPLMSRSYTDPTARRRSVREELEAIIGPRYGGTVIHSAPKNVKMKIDMFKRWLHHGEGKEPDFYAFDTGCNEKFIYEIENYIWDQKKGLEKGLKDQPKKIDDDILDTIMQVCLTLPNERVEDVEKIESYSVFNTDNWRM